MSREPTEAVPDAAQPPLPYNPSTDEAAFGDSDRVESAHESENIPTITSEDAVIAVMGITGVGKSTFISHFSETAKIGKGLESYTINVGMHEAKVGDQKCFLIDTPGFDDTHRSDTDVLREIADWLNRSYQANIQLAGIVYLQVINNTRVTGSSLRNLRMFRKLCGEKGLSCVVLVTTMWSLVEKEDGARREAELCSNKEFWADMVRAGSKVFRHNDGKASATKILQHILAQRRRIVLEIQEEMASGKLLDETSAGRELEVQIAVLKAKHEKELKELREEMTEAQRTNDKRALEEIAAIRAAVEAQINKAEEDREKMHVTVTQLQEQRNKELEDERKRNFELRLKHEKDMLVLQQDILKAKMENDHKAELAQLTAINARKNAEKERLAQDQEIAMMRLDSEHRIKIAEVNAENERKLRLADEERRNDSVCSVM